MPPSVPREAAAFAVTALGAATCFGSVVHAAAAARAGMLKSCALEEPLDADEDVFPVAHPMLGVTDGFDGAGRLARIADAALADILPAVEASRVIPARLGLFVAFPSFEDAAESDGDDDDDDDDPPQESGAQIANRLVRRLCLSLGVDPGGARVKCYAEGRRGTVRALREAMDALRRGQCDACLVGACDSGLDATRLDAAYRAGRLKTTDNPVGFMPGEAGAFILLERSERARSRGEEPRLLLFEPATAEDERARGGELPPVGVGLAHAVLAALQQAGAAAAPGTVYTDLNGEPRRAGDWGNAQVRLRGVTSIQQWKQESPGASFGDVGAAAPLLAVCLACRSFARGYAHGSLALITVADDGAHRAAMVLDGERAAGRERTIE